ncbi:hypothetical protein A3A46_03105 [Candidatus Roizmanbacteria bacterium RIFCSPLOWO2_01_FULL_37_13]|uniref:LTD domain-containing protein n=1 Tax=Candidatus Roizmanbacteria bacterium RIFCSPHIGHO2_02_FULL_38_11 TaxID=1802039 RepID=A0A1F7GWQ4_9BACT|nr:MAG: hypothetical protein A3C25_01940 [Candidatus Roizmanbacteria bacterium RIFCSPHIGHO2_02_FULL_38_11]OGK43121.1 MAG: hypothetical protein A3A46_03105 [Candidatus Roizmanbacteria bacterium RIFCSPLOWO2_01_FULL_37_13]
MEKKIKAFFFLLFLFLVFAKKVSAISITTSNIDKINVALQESFQITTKISEGSLNTNYFIKCRIGENASTLNEGQTLNSSSSEWLYDTDAWSKMPQVTVDNTGSWEGVITCRVKNTANLGNKLVFNRACQNNSGSCDNSFQSTSFSPISLVSPLPTLTSEPINSLQPTDNPFPTIQPTPASESSPTSTPKLQNYNNIYISEVMIDPDTGANEWVEIYNGNDYEIILTDWHIDDIENSGSTPKKFYLTINPKDYSVLDLSSSMFNNDGDSVRLLDFTQKEIDSFQYQSSEKGKSLGRTSFDNDSFCLQTPTKKNSNGQCINPTPTPTPKSTTSSTSTITPTYSPLKTITIIKTPTKARSTVTPVKFSLFTQNLPPTSDSPQEINDSVLGITINNETPVSTQTHALLSSLSFTSFAYSLLAIISIFLKMKINA